MLGYYIYVQKRIFNKPDEKLLSSFQSRTTWRYHPCWDQSLVEYGPAGSPPALPWWYRRCCSMGMLAVQRPATGARVQGRRGLGDHESWDHAPTKENVKIKCFQKF